MAYTPYDQDIVAWSRHQAEVLRALARTRRDLPNDLDLANIAEEIEDLGRSELRAVESFLRLILAHLAKAASAPEAPAVAHWRTEVTTWHNDLVAAYTPAMRQNLDMDLVWRRALREAEAALAEHGGALAEHLRGPCPVGLDTLLAEGFEFQDAVAALSRGM